MLSLRNLLLFLLLPILLMDCSADVNQTEATETTMNVLDNASLWVGTYTRKEGHVDGKANGLYGLRLEGEVANIFYTQEDIVNPSFVCQSANGKYLYAVSELGPAVDSTGYVYSYRMENDKLVFLNRQPSYSFAPCYVSVSEDNQWLYLANYVGGMIVRYPLASDGEILPASSQLRLEGSGPDASRQEDSHPNSAVPSPDGKWVMVADLGTDKVHSFRATGEEWEEVTYIDLPAGAGPRHLTFHPKAPYAYLVNELNSSVTALYYNADNGALHIIEHYSTLPASVDTFSLCADIHITPDGRYLYASNRGHNSLAAYEVNASNGELKPIGHYATRGDFPRNFAIHPSGNSLLVANQNTDNIVQFNIVPETGQLIYEQKWEVKTPVCLVFLSN